MGFDSGQQLKFKAVGEAVLEFGLVTKFKSQVSDSYSLLVLN